jgi:N-hydroxyarylamine O-acetyltransferase
MVPGSSFGAEPSVKRAGIPLNRETRSGRNSQWRMARMIPDIALDSYFARIGYTGAQTATLETLTALHALHPATIAFENLDVLMKRPISLEPGAIAAKLVDEGRGGYCYEHNTLFLAVLRALGFSASSVAARVLWNFSGTRAPPRIHMLLCVGLPDGRYLADVGYGRLTLTQPLRLEPGVVQWTPHGDYRLVASGDEFMLEAKLAGTWKALYQLSLQDQTPADWEVANWYTATHPDSTFTQIVTAARAADECRYALRDNRLRIYRLDGAIEQRLIETPHDLGLVLRYDFKINLPQGCESVLAQAVARRSDLLTLMGLAGNAR